MDILEDAKLGFLLDPEDTIYHFEKVQNKTEDERMGKALNLDHAQKLQLAEGVNNLKRKMAEFIKSQEEDNENNGVITADKVYGFFESLKRTKYWQFF